MKWPKHILIVYNGRSSSTSGQLFSALSQAIGDRTSCQLENNSDPSFSLKGLASVLTANFFRLAKLIRAEVLVFHSYLIFSLPNILVARLLGKRVIVFQWDVYPTTLKGRPMKQSKARGLMDRLDARLYGLANTIVVPSIDFIPCLSHKDIRVMPIWPNTRQMANLTVGSECTLSLASKRERTIDEPWRLCFAGQLTKSRGLEVAADHLAMSILQPFELHLFSSDPLPEMLLTETRFRVVKHEFLPPDELSQALSDMDFGLVSLHTDMDQPAFPSKLFEFAGARLPVLYFGPSLPGFREILQDTGIGKDISLETNIDLAELYSGLKRGYQESCARLFDRTKLTEESVWSILHPKSV